MPTTSSCLHYQPIFDVARGELIGVEALLRWLDPERGMVPPGEFIPLAEETGLIEAIGDWVVGAVCEQQVEWAATGLHPQISFNVSPRQLRRLDFADRVADHLERTGADPTKLTAELTESTTMEDPAGVGDDPARAARARAPARPRRLRLGLLVAVAACARCRSRR